MLETLIRHLDMVRLTLSAVAVATLLVGCVGFISDPSDDGLTVNQRKARDLFVGKAYTVAMEQCGGCHVTLANSDFLKGNAPLEVYQTIKEFKPGMINFIDAAKSRLLTKGVHSGPEFALATRNGQTESDYEVMLAWLRAEQRAGGDAVGGDGPSYIVTAKFTPTVCMGARAACQVNTVSLRGIRPDKTGIEADVEFLYEVLPLSNSPYLANLKVKAGAEGAYVESPVFLGYTAGNTTPTIDGDAFFAIKTNVAANMSATIGGGFAGLTDLRALSDAGAPNEMAISFQVIDKYKPEGGAVDPSVCKAVASYVANVKPILAASCNNCHGAAANNAGAKGNMTITPADDVASCQQAKRNAVDLNNIPSTAIFIAPKPGASNHPVKLNPSTAWETAVTTWLTAEKTAP